MRPLAWAMLGLALGAALSSAACSCPPPSQPEGAYVLPQAVELRGSDRDVRVVVDRDEKKVFESFVRNGKRYSVEYRIIASR